MLSHAPASNDLITIVQDTQKPINYWMYLIRKQVLSTSTMEEIVDFLTQEKSLSPNNAQQLTQYYQQVWLKNQQQPTNQDFICCVQRIIAQEQNAAYHYLTDQNALQEWFIPFFPISIDGGNSFNFEGLYQVQILDIEPDQTIHIELTNTMTGKQAYLHLEFIPKSTYHTTVRITHYHISTANQLAIIHAYWSCFLNSFRKYVEQKWILKQAS